MSWLWILVIAELLAILVLSWKAFGMANRVDEIDAELVIMRRQRHRETAAARDSSAPWGPQGLA